MPFTTVNKSTDHFNTKLYTGNGSTNAVTGIGFQPDFVWLKPRNLADHHRAMDAVRTASYFLSPNQSSAQSSTGSHFASFDSDGFTLGGSDGGWNNSSYNYVTWNWKANGAGVSNTDGDITSTVSANTTSGVSIIKFTGNSSTSQSFGHGLNGKPKFYMIKNITDSGDNWQVYYNDEQRYKLDTTETGEANYLMSANSTTITTPSQSGGAWGNANGKDFIVYAFQEIQGFSRIGEYNANNSSDGVFLYTGFRVAWLMIKNIDSPSNATIWDSKRTPYNVINKYLNPDTNGAEGTSTSNNVDFLSNGIKLRSNNGDLNYQNRRYVFLAFAEAPLVGSNNVPCTAR